MACAAGSDVSLMPLGGEIRILRLFSRLNIGGPSVHVVLLTAALAARGYRTRLVVGRESPREGNFFDLAEAKGVSCVRLGTLGRELRPWRDLRAVWTLAGMMREYRPHIVHTHTAKAGAVGRVAARIAGVPVVVHTYHGHVLSGYFGRLRNEAFRRVEAALQGWTTALVAVSSAVKRDLVELRVASEERIRVIPLGLELEPLTGALPRGHLRGPAGCPEEAPLIGIVGRLAPIKDVGTFLRAASLVRERCPQARFAVVGDGEERASLEALARELGLDGAVHFHGWQREMGAVYGDLDVVVNCSLNEGTPVALIEALAAGRPVVATAVGGTPELLAGGAHGLLVPPGDAAALAEAVLRALAPAGEERRQAARQHVLSRHAAARLVADMDACYRELLAARGRPA